MEDILTAEQVAQILQVHPFTVLKFIKQGKLKASKLGRVYRIRKSDVDSFLESQVEHAEKAAEKPQVKNKKKTPKADKKNQVLSSKEKRTENRGETEPVAGKVQNEEVLQVTEIPKANEITEITEIPETQDRNERHDIDHYIIELKAN